MRRLKKEDEEEEEEEEEVVGIEVEEEEEDEDLRSNSSSSIDVNSSGSCTGRGGDTTTTTSVVSSSSSQIPPQIRAKSSKSQAAKKRKKKKKKSDDLCDACASKNAVWYCPADDAYLCDSCDQSVHSANAFSLRHERVSLQAEEATTEASLEETKNKNRAGAAAAAAAAVKDSPQDCKSSSILKRARCGEANYSSAPICKSNKMIKLEASEETSGQQNHANQNQGSSSGVEGEGDEECEDLEQELAHTVPVFEEETHEHSPASGIATDLGDAEEDLLEDADIDRFLNSDDIYCCDEDEEQHHHEEQDQQNKGLIAAPAAATCDDLNEFLGGLCSDDLLDSEDARFDFAIRKNSARIPGFGGFIDGSDGDGFCPGKVKLEEDEQPPPPHHHHHHQQIQQHYNADDFLKPCREEILGWNSHGQNHAIDSSNLERCFQQIQAQHQQRRICLRLDYEDVLNAWSDRRPFLTDSSSRIPARAMPEDSTSDIAGSSDVGVVPDLSRGSKSGQCVEQAGQVPVVSMMGDVDAAAVAAGGGREARVTRYREKRRTRLFSKKIRYEVRKLNAERRPRLKGRFVKRSPGGN